MPKSKIAWVAAGALLLSWGGTQSYAADYNYDTARPQHHSATGRVTKIETIHHAAHNSHAGAVVGGIVGGVLGHQVGSGRGNDVATVAGAVGGAVVGNEIEKKKRGEQSRDTYNVTVHLDDGSTRTYEQEYLGKVRTGSRVRVDNNRVVLR